MSSSSASAAAYSDIYHYAILMETSGQECESWMNFIRYEGNEEALHFMQSQFEKIRFILIDDLSTFDLDLDHLVSEQTAREMCSVDLNAYMFHRKFDGHMQMIDFRFSRKDRNEDRIVKVHEMIGLGNIDQYVDGEDPCEDGYELYSNEDDDEDDDETQIDEESVIERSSEEEESSDSSEESSEEDSKSGKKAHRRRPHRR